VMPKQSVWAFRAGELFRVARRASGEILETTFVSVALAHHRISNLIGLQSLLLGSLLRSTGNELRKGYCREMVAQGDGLPLIERRVLVAV
jgi:hypothetical protein